MQSYDPMADRAKLSPEELAALEEHERATKAQREAVRTAGARYQELAARMEALLARVQTEKALDFFELNFLQQNIIQFHQETGGSTLFDILQLVRFGTQYYAYHALNVALLNLTIGKMLGFEAVHLERLVDAGLTIDLGMLLMPRRVLDGSKDLNSFDKAMIRKHPQFSLQMLEKAGLGDDARLVQTVASHHERWNGTGYPSGISGEAIPLEARITAVSDSFDAATARRGHRDSKSPFAILAELYENEGGALDPAIAQTAAVGIAQMLVGRFVVLSDRSVGKVVEVQADNLAYPAVVVVGRRVQTGPQLYPLNLSGQMQLF